MLVLVPLVTLTELLGVRNWCVEVCGISQGEVCTVLTELSRLLAPPISSIDCELPAPQHLRLCRRPSNSWTAFPPLPYWPPIVVSIVEVVFKCALIASSPIPFRTNSSRSFLFSSATLLAAPCISAEASMPCSSHPRSLASNSCRYSFRRARLRL